MKRILPKGLIRRSTTGSGASSPDQTDQSPEAILLRELTTFCEVSNSPQNTQGNEFVHLPLIVESAESSPAAAKEAAVRIRKYLSTPIQTPNHVQYNAIMLMRILTDNPGHSFTKNFDSKFVTVIKELLRSGCDWHVQHYLRQFLHGLETSKAMDEDLQPLLAMWAKEKAKSQRQYTTPYPPNSMAPMPPQRPQARPPRHQLPDPGELAARIEEARNSAKLLTQFVQTTPPVEMEGNELIKEFVDRCQTSSRLLQSYIHCNNPPPDEATLLTLIEANDEISVAISGQQRGLLKARKARGSATTSPASPASSNDATSATLNRPFSSDIPQEPQGPEYTTSRLSELPAPAAAMSGGARSETNTNQNTTIPRSNTERSEYNSADFEVQNPFADDFATHDSDNERNHAAAQGSRVHAPTAEQGR
ncbi:unnamed protein product [Penicillium pancosmium]